MLRKMFDQTLRVETYIIFHYVSGLVWPPDCLPAASGRNTPGWVCWAGKQACCTHAVCCVTRNTLCQFTATWKKILKWWFNDSDGTLLVFRRPTYVSRYFKPILCFCCRMDHDRISQASSVATISYFPVTRVGRVYLDNEKALNIHWLQVCL